MAPAQRPRASSDREGLDVPEAGGHEGPGARVRPTLTPVEPGRALAWPREWWIPTGGLRTCRPVRPRLWHPWNVPVAAIDRGAARPGAAPGPQPGVGLVQ